MKEARLSPGDMVEWITRDRVTRQPSRSVLTRIMKLEPVLCSDGSTVDCAILQCNRLVRVADLFVPGEGHGVSPPNEFRSDDAKVAAVESPQRKSVTTENQHSAKSNESHDSRRADALPLAVDQTCNVMAIDFLNLLVRAFHAGKPTETHAVRSMFQTVANAIRKLRPAHIVFAMDGGHKERSELLPAYKAHRPESEPLLQSQKALAEKALRIAGFHCVRVVDWEADDVLASLAQAYSDTVIVSSDKDLLCMTGNAIRCRVFHPWGEGTFVTSDEKIGLPPGQVTDYLALCGDSTDGIPGVKGIGPKTAVQLLQEYGSLEGILVAASTGSIKGAVGQKLKEQRDAALLCRRVVQLNHFLPLPELADVRPVAGWQQSLQVIGLSSVAAILDALHGSRAFSASGERQGVSPPSDHAASESVQPGQTVVQRSNLEQIRRGITMEERWKGPDRGLISCWESGREAFPDDKENPWKQGTPERQAWQQGFDGLDLLVLINPASADTSGERNPREPEKVRQASLF